jgi:hypothetical protein
MVENEPNHLSSLHALKPSQYGRVLKFFEYFPLDVAKSAS